MLITGRPFCSCRSLSGRPISGCRGPHVSAARLVRFASLSGDRPGFAVADLSERTRLVAIVRCRRQQCSHALERPGPSAMPAGLEL
jgi:hypothetical protein